MNENANRTPRRWLDPSAALDRFKPPRGAITGIAPAERRKVRYGFRLGNISLLIAQGTSSEVLEQAPIYRLPNTPPWLLGSINLRGNLVTVFDVKQFLELDDGNSLEKRRLLILDRGDRAAGIAIDGLPQAAATGKALSRLPPLPAMLRPHIIKAYTQEGGVWLEFDHQGFFKALGQHIAGTA